MTPAPYAVTPSGLSLALRVIPKAKRNRIEDVVNEADGSPALKVAVTAAPEAGKANAAVIALLAKEWRLAKSAIRVTRGGANRRKTLAIEGDGSALKKQLDGWFAERKELSP
ncbi:MAG TPA: DUF167 family protein [Alphaproteobacteria bacterium]|nr:DUF167 family protein [Alphaproteobacteria bacterium]